MRKRTDFRQYPLETPGEISLGLVMGLSLIGAYFLAREHGSALLREALLALSFIILALFVFPRLVGWIMTMIEGGLQVRSDYVSASPELRRIEAQIELERERRQNLQILRTLNNEQIDYALKIIDFSELFTIHGQRVTWNVEGLSIPIDFAVEWMDAYTNRDGDQLPAQTDWEQTGNRQQKRAWARAISSSLMRAGYVRAPGGPLPARWIIPEAARPGALETIGLGIAYDLALYFAKESVENG